MDAAPSGRQRATRLLLLALALLALAAALGGRPDPDDAGAQDATRIGAPARALSGGQVSEETIRGLLRRAPRRPDRDSPELEDPDEERRVAATEAPAALAAGLPPSPAPVTDWQATTGSPPTPAVAGSPPDPQVAVSSTHVVVGINSGLAFYTKGGAPYPSGANYLKATDLFQPLIDPNLAGGAKLGLMENGRVDNFNDLRVVFDPYRKRFWMTATGTCRKKEDFNGDGEATKCVFELPKEQRRSVIGLAVSVDENPSHGWYLYWWDAAVGWGSGAAPYKPGDVADYPSIGINATTVDVSVKVSDQVRAYPHVALWRAADMAAGVGPTIDGWSLYPLISEDGGSCNSGFRNPDGSCPDTLVQPTLAHPDPGGSFLTARHPGKNDVLVVWKVSDLLQPTQKLQGDEVSMGAWNKPKDAPQKGGSSTNLIRMSNLGYKPLKAVWRGFLYVVTQDAASDGRANVRVLRLWTSDQDLEIPAPPNGGSRRFRIGVGSERSFGWAAIEVNKDKKAVIVYTVVGPDDYAGIRYNAWVHDEPKLRFGHFLKSGLGTMDDSADSDFTRWGDLAGASVDFVGAKQGEGIWITHEYARSNGKYGIWVGKVYGKSYPDFFLESLVALPRGGGRIKLSGRLANGGDRRAPKGRINFALLRPGAESVRLGSLQQDRLGPGRARRFALAVRLPAGLEPGPHEVLASVGGSRRLKEYSKRNNLARATFSIAGTPEPPPGIPLPLVGLPDIVIGELTTTAFTVENRGGSGAGAFEVTVSGAGAFRFDGLAAGAAASRRFPSPCSRTRRELTALADARLEVAESNEDNNRAHASCG